MIRLLNIFLGVETTVEDSSIAKKPYMTITPKTDYNSNANNSKSSTDENGLRDEIKERYKKVISYIEKVDKGKKPDYLTVKKPRQSYATISPSEDSSVEYYQRLQNKLKDIKKVVNEKKSLSSRVDSFAKNAFNMIRNAYDNTVGNIIVAAQHYKAKRILKNDPNYEVVYFMHGLDQNKGSQWRRIRDLNKKAEERGEKIVGVSLKGYHDLPIEDAYRRTYDDIINFHKKAGTLNEKGTLEHRMDGFSGHSSGANFARYLASHKDTKKLGIKYAQPIAATPYGFKPGTLPSHYLVKPLMNLDPEDNTKKEGRVNSINNYNRKPSIDVEGVAGLYDGLVDVTSAVDPVYSKFHIIRDRRSTHFGTSGSNEAMNDLTNNLLLQQRDKIKNDNYYIASRYYEKESYEPYRMAA